MPPRKRKEIQSAAVEDGEPVTKRRSLRSATLRSSSQATEAPVAREKPAKTAAPKKAAGSKTETAKKPAKKEPAKADAKNTRNETSGSSRAPSEDPDIDSIPTRNPNAPRHEGEWYWLMKAEPESRYENGIDVRFSIDDLAAKTQPEGWDGIRAYPARNNMRNMNAGDKAFFYHSNCKEPGIVGVMDIVKEYSEDKSARRPGTPYYDASSTKEKPKWDLVHVEFRCKFAVPITLKELRELGKPGQPLEAMQMLKQSRLSVSKVSKEEWVALCKVADEKAKEAGLEHEEAK